ncbi:MAG: alginate export family protein [Bacteroidales bacterium]|nr:alginate export family protein [Bacteroidales bacterium]
MKTGKLLFFISFSLINASAFGQFKIQGLIRPRFEYRNGYSIFRNDTSSAAAFISQRTRLNLTYNNEKIETYFSVFDFRIWGDQVWKKDVASIGLNEAWAKININDFWSVKFGRQTLKYDNNRLVSPVNWNQTGAAHDALKVNYINKGWAIDLVSAWNQSSQNKFGTDYAFSTSFYKSLNILRISKKFNKFSIASFNISDGFQDFSNPEKQHFRFTYGLIPNYKNDKYRITARAFGQTGKLQSGQNVKAFYTNIDFTCSVSKKIKLTAGNEIKSGNNGLDSLNTTDHAFDILYGAKHKFNGRIDYFSLPSTTKGTGFIDTYLKTRFNVMKYASLSAEYHYFMLENNYVYNGSVIDKFLGNEIDLVYKQDFGNDIALEAGYSFILGTESAEIIKGGNKDLWNHWFYMMVTINPTFFISKK